DRARHVGAAARHEEHEPDRVAHAARLTRYRRGVKLELVSHPLCPFVHRAAIMLHEKGVAFSTRYIDLKNKPEWFLALSPRGKVPVLVADGVTLFESAAIVEFLDETNAPRIIPVDPFERARQRAWVEVANDLLLAEFKVFTAPSAELPAARAALAPVLD